MPHAPSDLQRIPGIGPAIERELRVLGITRIRDLAHADPQDMYDRLCVLRGTAMDRCVLYTFRCAVHCATTGDPDAELRKWWNWTDERMAARQIART